MQNRALKICIFILYTLLIFQSYIFVIIPAAIYTGYDWLALRFIGPELCPFLTIPYWFVKTILYDIPLLFIGANYYELPVLILGIAFAFIAPVSILGFFFYWWYKKQFILTAWGIAFIGSIYAFSLFPHTFVLGDGGKKEGFTVVAFPVVNCFYFMLWMADLAQTKVCPHNKFANQLRRILAWPCIHPYSPFSDGQLELRKPGA